jgi:hypothetical protein
MSLVAEGWDQHIPKGYIYFAMGFSVLVEMLNLRVRQAATKPVQLRSAYTKGEGTKGAVPPPTERERAGKAV